MAFLIWIESFMKLPNALLSTKQINYEIMQQLPTKGSCEIRHPACIPNSIYLRGSCLGAALCI
jgi:hypothetical protein